MKHIEFTLAAALRQMLDESGMHQSDLAVGADISKGSVTNYAKGRTVPRWSAVQRWAEACGFDPEDKTLRALWVAARYGNDPAEVTHRKGAATTTVRTTHEVRRRVHRQGESLSERLIA